MERKKRICPTCGNEAWLREIAHHAYDSKVFWERDARPLLGEFVVWLAVCETCDEPALLGDSLEQAPEDVGLEGAQVLWPEWGFRDDAPARVMEAYVEARRARAISPGKHAAALRHALEVVCDAGGVPRLHPESRARLPLARRLEILEESRQLPKEIGEAMELLKELGNEGAHELDSIREGQSHQLDAIFRAVVEYVFVLPLRLERFQSQLRRIQDGSKTPKA